MDFKKMSFGERLRYAREKRGLSQQELADAIPMTQPALHNTENGRNKGSTKIIEISLALRVNPVWLYMGEGEMEPEDADGITPLNTENFGLVPVISWVTAGNFNNFESLPVDEFIRWVPCPFPYREGIYALEITGVSMSNPGHKPSFEPNDIIFVDSLKTPVNKSCVVVSLADEPAATFKQLIIEPGDKKYLVALNPTWGEKPIPINGNAVFNGVAIGKYEDL